MRTETIDIKLKSATVRARVNIDLKTDVESVLDKLGLSMSEAIVLFMAQIKLRNGIPFEIRVPNEVTAQTFRDTDANCNLVHCTDAANMFDELGI